MTENIISQLYILKSTYINFSSMYNTLKHTHLLIKYYLSINIYIYIDNQILFLYNNTIFVNMTYFNEIRKVLDHYSKIQ